MSEFTSLPDRAIQTVSGDKLDRSQFVGRLVASVVNPTIKISTGVTVGISGPWGSGKSSILNLLQERLMDEYPDALIVRFDPWLVSGRNDLIEEFLGELVGTINSKSKQTRKLKALGSTIADYGAELATFGNLVQPGVGSILSGGLKVVSKALRNKQSLSGLRAKLLKQLNEIAVPIVVLVDEIDRIEDDEVRTVAQLVRSVADFPRISYVLAYDSDRVIQALGRGSSDLERSERGRSYLEKIVQLQIPIPILLDEEIDKLLTADLIKLAAELELGDNLQGIPRYAELMSLLCGDVITTPRDIKKLAETFRVLRRMLIGEVDWIDLLAYSALVIKTPATVERMRREPEDYLASPMSMRSVERRFSSKGSKEPRLQSLIAATENTVSNVRLMKFLFPSLEQESQKAEHPDALSDRRPLFTTLRLGLLPGSYPREVIESLIAGTEHEVESFLQQARTSDVLTGLIDRIEELYLGVSLSDRTKFWRGVGRFLKKPNGSWMTSYQPMHEIVRNFADILVVSVRRN